MRRQGDRQAVEVPPAPLEGRDGAAVERGRIRARPAGAARAGELGGLVLARQRRRPQTGRVLAARDPPVRRRAQLAHVLVQPDAVTLHVMGRRA